LEKNVCNEKNETKNIHKFDQSVMPWSKNGKNSFCQKKMFHTI